LYVEMMGGAGAILGKAQELYDGGDYRLAMEILNKLVYAEPQNASAKDLLAAVFEQLGYQYESASMRNVFLAAAQELRNGTGSVPAPRGTSPSLARAMTTSQWWDAIATRVDSERADGVQFVINFVTPDTGQEFVVELSGGTLTNIEGYQSDTADATITMNRTDLDTVIRGRATLAEQLQAGVGSVSGDSSVLLQLAAVLITFNAGFEVMPGTVTQ
jgi:alkyl sulfatase BDS1-like metallo-beta-lactamase superfamily hydrolase